MNFYALPYVLILSVFLQTHLSAQHTKIFIQSKTPFKLLVDNEDIHEKEVSMIKLRLNRGETYNFQILDAASNEALFDFPFKVGAKQKKGKYMIKYRKKRNDYKWVVKSEKDKGPSFSERIENLKNTEFTVETHESYSGPDGAYSKSSKTEGTLGNFTTKKGNVKADENGVSAESSTTTSDNTNLLDDLAGIKLPKRKKKEDNRRWVVLKAK